MMGIVAPRTKGEAVFGVPSTAADGPPEWLGFGQALARVLLGDAAFAVSLIAGKGATLALAGAVVLADALADRPGATHEALAAYEGRLRPWVDAAHRMARRNVRLFTPANRFQLLGREAVLRVAARPFLAPWSRGC